MAGNSGIVGVSVLDRLMYKALLLPLSCGGLTLCLRLRCSLHLSLTQNLLLTLTLKHAIVNETCIQDLSLSTSLFSSLTHAGTQARAHKIRTWVHDMFVDLSLFSSLSDTNKHTHRPKGKEFTMCLCAYPSHPYLSHTNTHIHEKFGQMSE